VINGKSVIYFFFSFSLDTCAKLRRTTVSCFMSVCLSVRPSALNNGNRTERIFTKFDIWVFFENMLRKFKFYESLKRVLYMTTSVHSWQYLAEYFATWEIFRTGVVGKIKTHFVFNTFFFLKSCFFEIIWRNIEFWIFTKILRFLDFKNSFVL